MQSATVLVAPTALAVAGSGSADDVFETGAGAGSGGSLGDTTVAANAQGTGGAFQTASPAVNLIIDQASQPSGTVSGSGAPVVTVVGNNTANVTGSAPVLQTANVVSRPVAAAILLDSP
jgi:hypothetical protein